MDTLKNLAYGVVLIPPVPPNLGTSLTMAAGHSARFPAPPFNASIWPFGVPADPANTEIIRVTAISGEVWTIQRTQENTQPRTIENGDQVAQAMTNRYLTELIADLKAYADAAANAAKTYADAAVAVARYPGVWTLGSAPSITINTDLYDLVHVTGQAETLAIQNPIGTAREGQSLILRLRDNGLGRALQWGGAFSSATSVALPAATVTYKTLHLGFRWNSLYGRWQMIAITQEL